MAHTSGPASATPVRIAAHRPPDRHAGRDDPAAERPHRGEPGDRLQEFEDGAVVRTACSVTGAKSDGRDRQAELTPLDAAARRAMSSHGRCHGKGRMREPVDSRGRRSRAATGVSLLVVGTFVACSALAVDHRQPLPPAVSGERRETQGRAGWLSYYVAGTGSPLPLVHSINAA